MDSKNLYLSAAGASLAISIAVYFGVTGIEDNKLAGIYIGLWVPSILLLGQLLGKKGK